ncbi:hypothetical protein ABIF65_004363 [Bradyrhizobium japonicum]|nr:hypothetical protein [Bradyrhizobium japonicum]MCP1781040.1 hypothetical protein [Bradyrhizobium japonicum]MCP1860394.1 hypothetical protein [Bradyrhizobium japonicum]MCP1891156.1 hypothetical protein [Bradyrhizobium japonicum]MCP1955969.1 hypothetical protein [Bradyrhizobium japonicum]
MSFAVLVGIYRGNGGGARYISRGSAGDNPREGKSK